MQYDNCEVLYCSLHADGETNRLRCAQLAELLPVTCLSSHILALWQCSCSPSTCQTCKHPFVYCSLARLHTTYCRLRSPTVWKSCFSCTMRMTQQALTTRLSTIKLRQAMHAITATTEMKLHRTSIANASTERQAWTNIRTGLNASSRLHRGRQLAPMTTNVMTPEVNALVVVDKTKLENYRSLNLDDIDLEALGAPVPTDYYQLLGLKFDTDLEDKPMILQNLDSLLGSTSSTDEGQCNSHDHIKQSYRRLLKLAHPDIAGEAATELAGLLNHAYTTLTDPQTKEAYDSELRTWRTGIGSYDGKPVSYWAGPPGEDRAIFVDETTCIGCMMCTVVAPNTFHIEDEWGRARVHTQWADNEEDIKEAVSTCPVDCIYWVDKQQLPLLEYAMKGCQRECVATMGRRRSGNMGMAPSHQNPFYKAEEFVKQCKKAGVVQIINGGSRTHDDVLATRISRAWLALPAKIRAKGWPELAAAAAAAVANSQ